MKRNEDVPKNVRVQLPGMPGKPGRPCTGTAMSNKERQRKYRQRHKYVDIGERMNVTITKLAKAFELTEDQVTRELIRFALCNRNWDRTGFPGVIG